MSEDRELWKQRYFMDNYSVTRESVQTLTDKSGESDEALAAVNWAREESRKGIDKHKGFYSVEDELFITSVNAFAAGVIWADKKLTREVIGPLKDKILDLNQKIRSLEVKLMLLEEWRDAEKR